MKTNLLQVAIRHNAIIIPKEWIVKEKNVKIEETTSVLLTSCMQLGYTFSEELLHTMHTISAKHKLEILSLLKEVTGVNKNWTPLIKQWNVPTGESIIDHVITAFDNAFSSKKGIKLPCNHHIPNNTFPIDRYNGCPFCGTPFKFEKLNYSSPNKLKILELWRDKDAENYLSSLLSSKAVLDATQIDSLKILLLNYNIPNKAEITSKETLMVVIDVLVEQNKIAEAGYLFNNPKDILRYLWFKKTGFLQIIEPKTIIERLKYNAQNYHTNLDESYQVKIQSTKDLKLKFNRKQCKMYATWLNSLTLDVKKQCEIMHPKRNIWVRVIRALRLAEYSKRKGFENLANLLDVFYRKDYEVWEGKVHHYKLKSDAEKTFALLKQRPSLFARALFSSMLWFGKDITLLHFREVINEVPNRLVFTLHMYAELYFDKNAKRSVKPLGGINKKIPVNKLVKLYSEDTLQAMITDIRELSLEVIKTNFKKEINLNKTVFIDKGLYNIPIAIGDRSENIQDLPSALMGTRFKVEGDKVRLFMQWGNDLPAQHLDMDLSCHVAYADSIDYCSYMNLSLYGCQHSGDIQSIPNKVGTAEYIDIDLQKLNEIKAKYVTFTCNAYSNGSLSPNLVVGWMQSKFPMKITKKGVAYNPSTVQHQVKIKQSLTKGMVFGVLDVEKRDIIWLEMAYSGQIVQNLKVSGVEPLLRKLDAKLKIGDLLQLKATTQNLEVVSDKGNADEVYDMNWALDSTRVLELFLE